LRSAILRGEFAGTGRLPSERSLMARFGVHRNTVRQALDLLKRDGLLQTESKTGSFVQAVPKSERNVLVLAVHSDPSPELSRLMDGFTHVAAQAGFVARRTSTQPGAGEAMDRVPRISPGSNVAGVALWPQNPTDVAALHAIEREVPLVLVDRRVLGFHGNIVRFDDVAGGRLVTEHLIEKGHRKIAFVTDEVFAETVQLRWRGYVDALDAASIPFDPRLNLFFNGLVEPFFGLSMRHLLTDRDLRPTAIVCSNDLVAFSMLRFLSDQGVKVPGEMAVTGYGNCMPDYADAMALTTVDQPFYDIGREAAGILIDHIGRDPSTPALTRVEVTVPVSLAVRRSSLFVEPAAA
ncbi:MAG TPA: GntR family transcriptional regulator, partial [Fimbriimonas sp.]